MVKFLVFFLIILSGNCLAKANPIAMGNTLSKTYTFQELGWNDTRALNGYKPSDTLYLPIPKYWNPQKAVVHLKLVFSPLLTENTQVDIQFNQTLIRTVSMPREVQQTLHLDIELPLTQLSPDWQTLSFSARFFSSKNLCNPDIWIYISPESSLTLTTVEFPFKGTLNQLSSLFISPITVSPVPISLLLPQNPALQEIFSLFRVALHLGQEGGDSKINLMAGFLNDTEKKQNNLILIGIAEHLFKETGLQLSLLTSNQAVKKGLNGDAGILLLQESPYNPMRGLLVFTGRNYSALHKAISAFLTAEFKRLASGNVAVVDKVLVSGKTEPKIDSYHTTLKALGYSDQSVSGLGRHRLSYNIPLPNDRIAENSSVKTFITTPLFTSKNSAQLTLLINGRKQSSFKLNAEHSAWEAQIDPSAMKPGVNKLEYIIDLHQQDERCTREDFDQVWATIYAQTEFSTLFSKNFPITFLNQLPVPFSSEVSVVVPDHLSSEDINNLTQLAFTLGQIIQGNSLSVNFLTSSEANEAFIRHHNIILYGTLENNPWITFSSHYLPLSLEGNARIFKKKEQQLQVSANRSTGLLELISSPWSEAHYLLLITGNNNAALSQAVVKLINDKARIQLEGNIALINADGSVELLTSEDTRYFSMTHQIVRYWINTTENVLFYIKNHPKVLIYLGVFLIPLLILLRQRKK